MMLHHDWFWRNNIVTSHKTHKYSLKYFSNIFLFLLVYTFVILYNLGIEKERVYIMSNYTKLTDEFGIEKVNSVFNDSYNEISKLLSPSKI